jgi:hypothetical protein
MRSSLAENDDVLSVEVFYVVHELSHMSCEDSSIAVPDTPIELEA